jgi:serine/threonine protein kinase
MQKQELTEAQVAWVVIDVSRALAHIHSKSIVHRDLRPDNVLLGNDFRLKLADFGSSAFIEELQTMSRPKLSADTYRNIFPHYQAPEQIQVTLQTTKVDIWGFGCLIYALLLQENAFSATDQVAQLRGAYRKPRRRLSSKWRHIFECCFQPDPSRRASAEDILHLISLDSLPQTVPIAESERCRKFSVLLDLFKSSTNSWVKAATSSHDGAPEAHYVHKLLM